jgi:hypothetical protein
LQTGCSTASRSHPRGLPLELEWDL